MATRSKATRLSATDSYLDLVRRFPLRPIRDDREHGAAVEIIEELIGHRLDSGASDYLDTLTLLVNKYEDECHTPFDTQLSPRQALKAIMDANGLSQADIAKIVGSESAVSMFLSGQRDLSKTHIKALAQRFRVDANLFL